MMEETTGTVTFIVGQRTFKTWYRVFGDFKHTNRRPVVVIHDGPGLAHHYLLPLRTLYKQAGIPIVLYDQIGSGASSHFKDASISFWHPRLFMDQLDSLVEHLDIHDNFDLLGHGWGGFLAAFYAATRPHKGLQSLIVSNAYASMDLVEEGLNLHLDRFPKDFAEMIRKHELNNTMDTPEYQKGIATFAVKHVCTLRPWPKELAQSFEENSKDPTVASKLRGPYHFKIAGLLKRNSIITHLDKISIPTLVIHAQQDEIHEIAVRPFLECVPNVRGVELRKSSHHPMQEEPETYFDVILDFLVGDQNSLLPEISQ